MIQAVTNTTTIAELEIKLQAFGLTMTTQLSGDGRFYVTLYDRDGTGTANSGTSLVEAINFAFDSFVRLKGRELALVPRAVVLR